MPYTLTATRRRQGRPEKHARHARQLPDRALEHSRVAALERFFAAGFKDKLIHLKLIEPPMNADEIKTESKTTIIANGLADEAGSRRSLVEANGDSSQRRPLVIMRSNVCVGRDRSRAPAVRNCRASNNLPLRNQPDFDFAPHRLGISLQRGERRRMLARRFET